MYFFQLFLISFTDTLDIECLTGGGASCSEQANPSRRVLGAGIRQRSRKGNTEWCHAAPGPNTIFLWCGLCVRRHSVFSYSLEAALEHSIYGGLRSPLGETEMEPRLTLCRMAADGQRPFGCIVVMTYLEREGAVFCYRRAFGNWSVVSYRHLRRRWNCAIEASSCQQLDPCTGSWHAYKRAETRYSSVTTRTRKKRQCHVTRLRAVGALREHKELSWVGGKKVHRLLWAK